MVDLEVPVEGVTLDAAGEAAGGAAVAVGGSWAVGADWASPTEGTSKTARATQRARFETNMIYSPVINRFSACDRARRRSHRPLGPHASRQNHRRATRRHATRRHATRRSRCHASRRNHHRASRESDPVPGAGPLERVAGQPWTPRGIPANPGPVWPKGAIAAPTPRPANPPVT
jgi:hypothetical protein